MYFSLEEVVPTSFDVPPTGKTTCWCGGDGRHKGRRRRERASRGHRTCSPLFLSYWQTKSPQRGLFFFLSLVRRPEIPSRLTTNQPLSYSLPFIHPFFFFPPQIWFLSLCVSLFCLVNSFRRHLFWRDRHLFTLYHRNLLVERPSSDRLMFISVGDYLPGCKKRRKISFLLILSCPVEPVINWAESKVRRRRRKMIAPE